jgi:hypothetical protein
MTARRPYRRDRGRPGDPHRSGGLSGNLRLSRHGLRRGRGGREGAGAGKARTCLIVDINLSGQGRAGDHPRTAGAVGNRDHPAVRPHRRRGPDRRAGTWGRRLCLQALQPARACWRGSRTCLRRTAAMRQLTRRVVHFAGFTFDTAARHVRPARTAAGVQLTRAEYETSAHLRPESRHRAVARPAAGQHHASAQRLGGTRTVDVMVKRLRAKFGDEPEAAAHLRHLAWRGLRLHCAAVLTPGQILQRRQRPRSAPASRRRGLGITEAGPMPRIGPGGLAAGQGRPAPPPAPAGQNCPPRPSTDARAARPPRRPAPRPLQRLGHAPRPRRPSRSSISATRSRVRAWGQDRPASRAPPGSTPGAAQPVQGGGQRLGRQRLGTTSSIPAARQASMSSRLGMGRDADHRHPRPAPAGRAAGASSRCPRCRAG